MGGGNSIRPLLAVTQSAWNTIVAPLIIATLIASTVSIILLREQVAVLTVRVDALEQTVRTRVNP